MARAVWIDGHVNGRRIQVLGGDRLAPDKEVPPGGARLKHPTLGDVYAVRDDSPADVADVASLPNAQHLLVEIAAWVPDLSWTRSVLQTVIPDPPLAEEIARLGHAPPLPGRTHATPPEGDLLRSRSIARFDFFVAMVSRTQRRTWSHCVRPVQAFVGSDLAVLIWGGPFDGTVTGEAGAPAWPETAPKSTALPAVRSSHRFPTQITGNDGPSLVARYMQHVLRNHEWALSVAGRGAELLELDFFTRDEGIEPLRRVADGLAEVGASTFDVRFADQALMRRAETQPAFPAALRNDVVAHGRRQEALADRHRGAIYRCFTLTRDALAHEEAARAQVEQERRLKEDAHNRQLQLYAGYIAALVLIPGLVAAIYGADVQGLPGQEDEVGLIVMLTLATVGAAATLLLLRRARQDGTHDIDGDG